MKKKVSEKRVGFSFGFTVFLGVVLIGLVVGGYFLYDYFDRSLFGVGIERALIASDRDLIQLSLVEKGDLKGVEFFFEGVDGDVYSFASDGLEGNVYEIDLIDLKGDGELGSFEDVKRIYVILNYGEGNVQVLNREDSEIDWEIEDSFFIDKVDAVDGSLEDDVEEVVSSGLETVVGGGSGGGGGGGSGGGGSSCVIDCSGLECGNDGCGGSCGTCLGNESCVGGGCVVLSCVNDSDCPTDYYENNSCSSDDVVRNFNNYSCVEEQCVINISVEFVEDCEDGLFCTGVESCSDGSCVSSGEPCDDGFDCTTDSCDDIEGCSYVTDDSICIGDKPECNESVCVAGVGCDYLPSGCEMCDVVNMPVDLLVGTSLFILPVAGGSFIDGGSADAVRGLDNLMGPYLGDAPDVGAYELGLGVPWHGPRNFTDLLAYGLPEGWSVVDNRSEQFGLIGDYLDLGALSNVDNNNFRLLITRTNPRAFVLVVFDEVLEVV